MMTISAILFLVAVWAVILFMTGYCFYRLLQPNQMPGEDAEGLPSSAPEARNAETE